MPKAQKRWFQFYLSTALAVVVLIVFWYTTTSFSLLSDSISDLCNSSLKHTLYCIPDIVEYQNHNDVAVKAVEEKMRRIRDLVVVKSQTNSNTCNGRGIFVYDLPPKFNYELKNYCHGPLPWTNLCPHYANNAMGETIPRLGEGWYDTNQYLLEPILHQKVLKHACRVHDPDKAILFYVPFYGGLDILRWDFNNVSHDIKDSLSLQLNQWLQTQNSWTRNEGRDHLFVLGKITWDFRRRSDDEWGSTFLKQPAFVNPYKFLFERHPWEDKEIGIPYPTHFHPNSDGDIMNWQARVISGYRRNLVGFAGASKEGPAGELRSVLIHDCRLDREHCKFLNCSSDGCRNPEIVINLFMDSEFCLQPVGDSPTRKSVFDSMIAGCIPVIFDPFTAYYQYPWHLPEDHSQYSVFIDSDDVRLRKLDVMEKLRNVTKKERDDMRSYIVYKLLPGLVYGNATSDFTIFRDAFSIAIDNLLGILSTTSQ